MNDPFESYKLYNALKLHFEGSYDAVKYNYKTNSTKGFEVSGTTIKNICETSKSATLRKPDEILPLILNRTIKQIDKQVWETLTTKVSVPNGRINIDCILLRVL